MWATARNLATNGTAHTPGARLGASMASGSDRTAILFGGLFLRDEGQSGGF